jgi:uncharacterized membrane protein YgdD (TMEM256/DUF423 family)
MRLWLMCLGALSGLFGAAGVALAAAGAHRPGAAIVTTAAYFLLFHAAALAAICALARDRARPGLLFAGTLIAGGTAVFSGDLALRGLANLILVHMAAPTGGMLLIAGWLTIAIAIPASLRTPPSNDLT